MTETRFVGLGAILGIVVGLILGVAAGLAIGWVVWPLQVTNVDPADLRLSAQNDYIVLIADAFAYDHDLDRAQKRLDLLNLNDPVDRVTRLARSYAERNEPEKSNLAELAVALGSTDESLPGLIEVTPTPEKVARPEPSATPPPTPTTAPTFTPTNTATPTTATTATKAATKKPKPTDTPQGPAPRPGVEWRPSYPDQWWNTIKFTPADVQPGQKYWRLVSALYCDREDTRNNCPDLPGGDVDYSIYVSLLGENGQRQEGELSVRHTDGTLAAEGTTDKVKSPDDMCHCNYSFQIADYAIQVKGLPSDSISGLCACSVNSNWSARAHVRYFLVFQLSTR